MARWKLSMRLATTNKHVTTSDMRKVQFQFRNKFAADFHHVHSLLVSNMDETSVTLDAPGMRTVEKKGAKCVEIGTTGHEFKRVGGRHLRQSWRYNGDISGDSALCQQEVPVQRSIYL